MINTAINYMPTPIDLSISTHDSSVKEYIENAIAQFLKEDRVLENPVILSISQNAISKLACFLTKTITRPVAISVSGGSASGKSCFTGDIVESILDFDKNAITKIDADNYYYDRSVEVKKAGGIAKFAENYDLDAPDAIELSLLKTHIKKLLKGKTVFSPKYMLDGTAIRYTDHTLCEPNPIIVSEGIFNLNERIRDVFDLTLYVDVSANIQKERWFARAKERDFEGELAQKAFDNVIKKASIHIEPTIVNADIVVNGEADRADYKKSIAKLLNIYQNMTSKV